MAALLLGGGAHGKRYALPHSRIMVHQPSAGFQAVDWLVDNGVAKSKKVGFQEYMNS